MLIECACLHECCKLEWSTLAIIVPVVGEGGSLWFLKTNWGSFSSDSLELNSVFASMYILCVLKLVHRFCMLQTLHMATEGSSILKSVPCVTIHLFALQNTRKQGFYHARFTPLKGRNFLEEHVPKLGFICLLPVQSLLETRHFWTRHFISIQCEYHGIQHM